ncbi:hypothetical protein ACFLRN_08015 [Thermoproteota archaeon]
MNKNILVFSIVLTAVALLITPVLANSAKRVLVDVDYGTTPSVPVSYWLKGNVQHGSLTIPYTGFSIIGDGIDLQDGTAIQTSNYIVNVKGIPTGLRTGKGVLHNKLEITFSGGKFVGTNKMHGIFKVFPNQKLGLFTGSVHGVLHGTGDYLGWTLVLSGEANEGTYEHEEYMFRP